MINMDIKGVPGVKAALKSHPGKAERAAAIALSMTAKYDVKPGIQMEMKRVFKNPTRYTLNSLYIKYAKASDLTAVVWFKEPDRMGEHYLVPQVEGGPRKLKGFERVLGNKEYIPGHGVRLNVYGNVSAGQIRQFLSVLGKAEHVAGFSANITERSRKKNKKERDYILLTKKHGKLPPGVYKRVQTARGFGAKTKATFADRSKTYQRGRVKKVIRARGLKPIMIQGKTGKPVKPLLDFYGIATITFNKNFAPRFWAKFNQLIQQG
jgi:hypothetical protein